MPKAVYLITQHDFGLDDLLDFLDAVSPDYTVARSGIAFVIESSGQHVDYCRFELETREGLLDEWDASNPILDLLLHNEHFGGSSNAFHATFCTPASPPFVAAIRSLVACNVDCLVYNCHEMTATGRDFLSTLASNPNWQWHTGNVTP